MNNRMQLLKLIMLFLGGIMPIPVVGYILHTPKTLIIAFFHDTTFISFYN